MINRQSRRFAAVAMASVALVLALGGPRAHAADAAPIVAPLDGYDGLYRIVFVTTGTTQAESAVIGDYDAYVTAAVAAEASGLLTALGVEWKCLGSTAAVSARANTGTYTVALDGQSLYDTIVDCPIYTTTGLRIADDNADLWDGTIQNPVYFDNGSQAGVAGGAQEQTWTGTEANGDSRPPVSDGTALGDSGLEVPGNYNYVHLVRGGWTDAAWIGGGGAVAAQNSIPGDHPQEGPEHRRET